MEKRALVTISIGELGREMGASSHPLMEAYATKSGADFIVLDNPNYKNIYGKYTYEKLNCYELLNDYERILFVDSDVLISPNSPCLFEQVPTHIFAASNETRYSMSERDKEVTQKVLGPIDWKYPYFNAGVMLFSRSHKELFDPDAEKLKQWVHGEFRSDHINLLNDQPYFNYRLNEMGLDFVDLTPKFNHTKAMGDSHKRFSNYFIHYAGLSGHRYGERLEQIRLDAKILGNVKLVNFYSRHIRLRWLLDRMHKGFLLKYWKLLTNQIKTRLS